MRGNSGFILVAIGLFLLYVAVSDKYPVMARFMRDMFDAGGETGDGENDGAVKFQAPPGGGAGGGSWDSVSVPRSTESPFDMLQRMGVRVSTPPFVEA